MSGHLMGGHTMERVRKRPGSLTTILNNHHWACTSWIYIKIWCSWSLEKIHLQLSAHDQRYRSEEISPLEIQYLTNLCYYRHFCNTFVFYSLNQDINTFKWSPNLNCHNNFWSNCQQQKTKNKFLATVLMTAC